MALTAEEAAGEESSLELTPEEVPLPICSLHEAPVFLGPSRQVWQHLIHRTIGDILVDRKTCLTCEKRNLVTLDQCTAQCMAPKVITSGLQHGKPMARISG